MIVLKHAISDEISAKHLLIINGYRLYRILSYKLAGDRSSATCYSIIQLLLRDGDFEELHEYTIVGSRLKDRSI